PRLLPFGIKLEAVCFSEPHDVQPVLRPTFSITRAGEQALHNFFISIRRMVGEKSIDFIDRRWQSSQIDRHATNQRALIGRRGRRASPLLSPSPGATIALTS